MLPEKWCLLIEVIQNFVKIRSGDPPRCLEADQITMLVMFDSLKQPAPWQDREDDRAEMHGALRQLLVSKESLESYMDRLGCTVSQFEELVVTNKTKAALMVREIVENFSSKFSVDQDLVLSRFRQLFLP